jgi:hypothetical protein
VKRAKTDLLIRDIAQLVLRYSLEDWAPLLAELEEGGAARQKLAAAIGEIIEKAQPLARQMKRRKGTSRKKTVTRASRTPFGEKVAFIIQNREMLPTLGHLRQLAFYVGMKAPLPPSRDRAAAELIRYMEALPEEHQTRVLDVLQQIRSRKQHDAGDDYQRWFSVILATPANRG